MKHNSCFRSPNGIVKTFGNKFYYFTKFTFIRDGRERKKVFVFDVGKFLVLDEWSVSDELNFNMIFFFFSSVQKAFDEAERDEMKICG
jgi:hypothetical protein